MWQNKISPKMLSFEIWRFFHQKRNIFDKILPFIFISHILARFCTQKKAKYIDVIFLFIFIFHILAKFHTKITPIFQTKYSFLYLIFTFWQIFAPNCLLFTVYNFTSIWDQRVHYTKGRSWRTNCPLVLAACHKFGQGDRVRSLHEFNKSACVGEG
jgi:hypothetical protein